MMQVNRVTYTNWENGKREPTLENVVKLAKILKTTTDNLLGLTLSQVFRVTNVEF